MNANFILFSYNSWEDAARPWDSLDSDGEEENFEDEVTVIFPINVSYLLTKYQVFDD